MHPEVQLQALIDTRDEFDYDHWKAISTAAAVTSAPGVGLEPTTYGLTV
jgi:hypothetical protein